MGKESKLPPNQAWGDDKHSWDFLKGGANGLFSPDVKLASGNYGCRLPASIRQFRVDRQFPHDLAPRLGTDQA